MPGLRSVISTLDPSGQEVMGPKHTEELAAALAPLVSQLALLARDRQQLLLSPVQPLECRLMTARKLPAGNMCPFGV